MFEFECQTGAAVHSFLQNLEFIVELCKQGALAERSGVSSSKKNPDAGLNY